MPILKSARMTVGARNHWIIPERRQAKRETRRTSRYAGPMLAGGSLALFLAVLACALGGFGLRLAAARWAGVSGWLPVFALDQKPWRDVALGRRALFAAAGPLGCYLVAVLAMTAGYALTGENEIDETSMRVHVRPGGPADTGGIHDGDRIIAVNGTPIQDWDGLKMEVGKHPREEISVEMRRNGDETVIARPTPDASGKIGVLPPTESRRIGLGAAFAKAFVQPLVVNRMTLKNVVRFFGSEQKPELSGPVQIRQETGRAQQSGFGNMLLLLGGLISYFLFVPTILSLVFFPRRPKGNA